MTTYIDLDSYYRIRETYPNPADYVVEDSQVRDWIREPRSVTAMSSRPGNKVLDFTQTVEIEGFTLPYTAITYIDSTGTIVNTHTADLTRIYVDVHTVRYNDLRLIQTIDDKLNKTRFVLTPERIQHDSADQPIAIQFRTNRMNQVMRFATDQSIKFTVMQERGFTIIIDDSGQDPDPTKQIWVNIAVKPYYRDGLYANHGLGLTQF
jgi:hypothetical protein